MKKLLVCLCALFFSAAAFAAQPVISWTYAAADVATYGVTSFSVERKAEPCAGVTVSFAQITSVANTDRSVSDPNLLTQNTTYCYRAAAVSALGSSAYSNTAEKTILGPPPAPTGLTVQ
jgi:hypothetical protein